TFLLIPTLLQKPQLTVGMIFNQSEPQSVEAIERIKSLAANNNINLVYLPVNTSADVQLVTQSLLNKKIDAFFANPDNTVFASFETIAKACNQAKVPIFTSEAGLVSRGAVAAFGADIYDWGFQSGEQAADFLAKGNTNGLTYTIVKTRKRVYNATVAATFGLKVPATFQAIQ
ncbi:MAG TPA: ABC transporter substrate-binding protein, partial [Chitinophagaceae bacterium]|nr:ABC transporter substrate-binding protein [Chitinophagaceae bacterium]